MSQRAPKRSKRGRKPVRHKKGKSNTMAMTGVERDSRQARTVIVMPVGNPDRLRVRLRYPIEVTLNTSTATRISRRWISNALYDVDPVFGSTPIPGFGEWSSIYNYNRVLSYKAQFSLVPFETFPITVYFIHTNTDPGTSATNYVDYANGAYGRQILLAGANAQKGGIITMKHSIRQIVGDGSVLSDIAYQGTAASNPTDLTYVAIGIQSSAGNLNNGVWISGHIEFEADFYDRRNLQSFFKKPPYTPDEHRQAYIASNYAESHNVKLSPENQKILQAMEEWKQERAAFYADQSK